MFLYLQRTRPKGEQDSLLKITKFASNCMRKPSRLQKLLSESIDTECSFFALLFELISTHFKAWLRSTIWFFSGSGLLLILKAGISFGIRKPGFDKFPSGALTFKQFSENAANEVAAVELVSTVLLLWPSKFCKALKGLIAAWSRPRKAGPGIILFKIVASYLTIR